MSYDVFLRFPLLVLATLAFGMLYSIWKILHYLPYTLGYQRYSKLSLTRVCKIFATLMHCASLSRYMSDFRTSNASQEDDANF